MAKNKVLKMVDSTRDSITKTLVYHGWEARLKKKQMDIKFAKLSNEQRQEVRAYWRQYGKKVNPNWAAYYSSMSGIFDKRIIPDSLYYSEILHLLNNFKMAGLADKNIASRIFTAKMPKVLLRRINNEYFDEQYRRVTLDAGLTSILQDGECFAKPARDSSYGDGTFLWLKEQGIDELQNMIEGIKGDLLVQEVVKQHKELAKYHPGSLNTVRVVSLRLKDRTVIINAILRMGVNNSHIDNFSAGGVIANLDENGQLFEENVQSNGKRLSAHPNTGVSFAGGCIPSYGRIVETVKRQHDIIPYYRLISWDFAVDESGDPLLIEGNFPSGQLDLHQLNKGGLFGEYTDEVLENIWS